MHHGLQKCPGGTPSFTILDRIMEHAGPFLIKSVEVIRFRNTVFRAGVDKSGGQWCFISLRDGYVKGAVAAVKFVFKLLIVLRLLEIREDFVISPAVVAEVQPVIIILALSADVRHGIGRAASTQYFSARMIDFSVLEAHLWFRPVTNLVHCTFLKCYISPANVT